MNRILLLFACAWLSGAAQAHEGHGAAGSHWHATDSVGFVVIVAAIALALWATWRK